MNPIGVIYIACLLVFFSGIALSVDHVFRGWLAAVSFFGMCSTGLALAVHAL